MCIVMNKKLHIINLEKKTAGTFLSFLETIRVFIEKVHLDDLNVYLDTLDT